MSEKEKIENDVEELAKKLEEITEQEKNRRKARDERPSTTISNNWNL